MKTQIPQPSEHQIQTQIMQYLRTIGWYVMRLNSGKYSVGIGRSKRFIIGQDAGTPDLMAFKKCGFPSGRYIASIFFIEVKRPKGKTTPLQIAKMKELEEHGAKCLVIHSLDELQEQLQ